MSFGVKVKKSLILKLGFSLIHRLKYLKIIIGIIKVFYSFGLKYKK